MRTDGLLCRWLLAALWCLPMQLMGQQLKISHLTGDFYVYTTYRDLGGAPFPSNSMYLVTTQGVVLFDTPWDTTQFQPLLDSIVTRHGTKAVMCLSTHYHDDRTAGLDYYHKKGIATWSSFQTRELCQKNGEPAAANTFLQDTTFTIGNYSFSTFYPGKGHTEDNIVVWFEKDRILYGGCLVKSTESTGLGNVADAYLSSWPDAIQKLLERYSIAKYVIPGHLGWKSPRSLEHTLRLLKEDR